MMIPRCVKLLSISWVVKFGIYISWYDMFKTLNNREKPFRWLLFQGHLEIYEYKEIIFK